MSPINIIMAGYFLGANINYFVVDLAINAYTITCKIVYTKLLRWAVLSASE